MKDEQTLSREGQGAQRAELPEGRLAFRWAWLGGAADRVQLGNWESGEDCGRSRLVRVRGCWAVGAAKWDGGGQPCGGSGLWRSSAALWWPWRAVSKEKYLKEVFS